MSDLFEDDYEASASMLLWDSVDIDKSLLRVLVMLRCTKLACESGDWVVMQNTSSIFMVLNTRFQLPMVVITPRTCEVVSELVKNCGVSLEALIYVLEKLFSRKIEDNGEVLHIEDGFAVDAVIFKKETSL